MAKKIFVERDVTQKLCKVFDCTPVMVWKALNYKSETDLARKIRHTALTQFGGVTSWDTDQVETIHDQAAKTMTQTFGERVKLVVSMESGDTVLYVDGNEEQRRHGLTIPAFVDFQHEVELIAASL